MKSADTDDNDDDDAATRGGQLLPPNANGLRWGGELPHLEQLALHLAEARPKERVPDSIDGVAREAYFTRKLQLFPSS